MEKTTKLNNSKSRFAKTTTDGFSVEEQVQKIGQEINDRKERAFKLGMRFMKVLKDKTLASNRNHLGESLEKEIVGDLIQFATDTNNDEFEKEGMGSVAICTLLFKAILHMRDYCNDLDYKINEQDKLIKELQTEIKKLSSQAEISYETK